MGGDELNILLFRHLDLCPPCVVVFFFFLAVLSLCCHTGLSLVAANPGYSLVAVHRLLTAVSSLCAEHGL